MSLIVRGRTRTGESSIRAIKRAGIRRFMQSGGLPKRTWCFCGKWYAGTRRLTAHGTPVLNGRDPAERVDGDTPDSNLDVRPVQSVSMGTLHGPPRRQHEAWLLVGSGKGTRQ